MIGALCALCLLQAAVTVILIPYSVDEVLATVQFLIRSWRVGRPFWRTLFKGDAGFFERKDEETIRVTAKGPKRSFSFNVRRAAGDVEDAS